MSPRVSPRSSNFLSPALAAALALAGLGAAAPAAPPPEVRGTWLTTTGNDAIASPENSAQSMARLKAIGLNTVYVETWKNGYTQYPSEVLKRLIGVDRRPALMKSDPSDDPARAAQDARDLLAETLIESHRQGLLYIAWFEYGFMAAHKDTDNHLRRLKPEWLSRDIKGNEVAPNGFVWMNPLHPEARRFLLDIVLEAVDRYDLDGVQLDDRIVWPYVTMGYDDYTRKIYAAEHNGKQPPDDHNDPEWVRWRADKVNEYSKIFVQEVRARRPGLIISLSPAVYPWSYQYYCLEWPKWAAWTSADTIDIPGPFEGRGVTPRWDEFIPQVYRFNFKAFEQTWRDQIRHMNELGAGRVSDLIAGIRVVGDGPNSSWEDLRDSINLVRTTGGGGHVHWFSRGVLDVYPNELTEFYNVAALGHAPHPKRPADWRPLPRVFTRSGAIPSDPTSTSARAVFTLADVPWGNYRVIVQRQPASATSSERDAKPDTQPAPKPATWREEYAVQVINGTIYVRTITGGTCTTDRAANPERAEFLTSLRCGDHGTVLVTTLTPRDPSSRDAAPNTFSLTFLDFDKPAYEGIPPRDPVVAVELLVDRRPDMAPSAQAQPARR